MAPFEAVSRGLSVAVLGPVELRLDGRPVAVPAGGQRALLAALLLAEGAVVPLDRLVSALWPEGPVPSARSAVQTYVARLRRALGPAAGALRTRAPGYLLDCSRAARDDRDFLAAADQAEQRAAAAPEDALRLLDEALGLWRGPAWAEFADTFARGAALRLEERRSAAQERRAELLLRTGRLDQTVAAAEALVADRPLAERPVVLLAEGLGAAGRVPEALAALAGYRHRLRDELGLDPGAGVEQIQARLLRGEIRGIPPAAPAPQPAAPAAPAMPGARPAGPAAARYRAAPLFGRAELLESLLATLREARLVSLVGPGGVGKTRLAQQVVADCSRPCWWVDLAPLHEGGYVARTIADAVGAAVHPGGTAVDALAEWAVTADGLLVLDNCEHLLPDTAAVTEAMLAAGPALRVLATSRERLGVDGELVQPVPPLPVPAGRDGSDPTAAASVQLFLDRARRADPSFAPRARELGVIGDLCRRLDGLPLAIEFAAARVRGLSVEDLAARLDRRLDLLTSDRRRDDGRHRTLRSVIEWSYTLLSPPEQAALRALGWFAGAFDLAAAEAVLAGPDSASAVDLVGRLVERSMLHRETSSGAGPARYRLLESVQAYVRERTGPEDAAAGERHTRWVLDLAIGAEQGLTGLEEARWVQAVTATMDDLRAVVLRARAGAADRVIAIVVARLWRFATWRLREEVLRWADGLPPDRTGADRGLAEVAGASARWMAGDVAGAHTRAVSIAEDETAHPMARAAAYEVLGDAVMGTGRPDLAAGLYQRSAAAWQQEGRAPDALIATANAAMASGFAGDDATAQRILADALSRAGADGNPSVLAFIRYVEGEVFADIAPDRALAALQEAGRLAAGVGNDLVTGLVLTATVALRGRHGPPDAAMSLYAEALGHWHRTGPEMLLVTTLRNLVVLFARTGRDGAAAELSATLRARAGAHPSYGPERQRLAAAGEAVAQRLGPQALVAAERAGRARTIREASVVALAVVARAAGP